MPRKSQGTSFIAYGAAYAYASVVVAQGSRPPDAERLPRRSGPAPRRFESEACAGCLATRPAGAIELDASPGGPSDGARAQSRRVPIELLKASPLPKGFLPRVKTRVG